MTNVMIMLGSKDWSLRVGVTKMADAQLVFFVLPTVVQGIIP